MKRAIQWSWLLALFLLVGCTSTPLPQHAIDQQTHQQQLSQFSHWQLSGKLAFKSKDEKFSAYVRWRQQGSDFSLDLNSFIGTNLMNMTGYPGYAKLQADDQVYVDNDASRLVERVTGWNIPVEKLSLWIKGQHEASDLVTYDEYGLVKALLPGCQGCQHWRLEYQKYEKLDQLWLPTLVVLSNQQDSANQIKIRIDSWKPI